MNRIWNSNDFCYLGLIIWKLKLKFDYRTALLFSTSLCWCGMNPNRSCKTISTHFHQERRKVALTSVAMRRGITQRLKWLASTAIWKGDIALCKLIVLHIDYQIQISPQKLVLLPSYYQGLESGPWYPCSNLCSPLCCSVCKLDH